MSLSVGKRRFSLLSRRRPIPCFPAADVDDGQVDSQHAALTPRGHTQFSLLSCAFSAPAFQHHRIYTVSLAAEGPLIGRGMPRERGGPD